MSRHRNIHNLDTDDLDDDFDYSSSYGSSYQDETQLSTSMDKYLYRRGSGGTGEQRGGSGHTPKMGHFLLDRSDSVPSVPEEDEDEGVLRRTPMRPRSDSETSSEDALVSLEAALALSEEDRVKLAACLETVLDIVGDTLDEQSVRDTIIKCDYDAEVAINTLLNNPVTVKGSSSSGGASGGRAQTQQMQQIQQPKRKGKTHIEEVDEMAASPSQPISMNNGARPKVAAAPLPVVKTTTPLTPQQPAAVSTSKRNQLRTPNVQSQRSSSPAVNKASAATPMRKARIDALEQFNKERGDFKPKLNLVVVGHVDSGKSTLMGHLLYELGSVSKKAMHKYEQESRKIGKQSFAYAWVLDETEEERDRGITMDVGQSRFETPKRSVTLLDAPGHRDFIPNMISGAYQADVAILVVNATTGEFEAGFDSGGQTREHALLVRSLGVSQLAVAVNKLDTVSWRQDRFLEIKKKLGTFLKTVGFRDIDVTYVPCSGYTGDNLVNPSTHLDWYSGGPTLVQTIDAFKPPQRLVEKPFRLSVSDVYKAQSSNGFVVAGRIEAGFVQKDDKVLILPLNEVAHVKNVLIDEMPMPSAFAGDHVGLVVTGAEQTSVVSGMVVCDPVAPIPVTRRIRARIVVFNIEMPITKGYPVVFHYGSVQCQAVIKKLVAEVHKSSGEVTKKKPRCLLKNCNAIVEIATDLPICVELYSDIKELGRFMLRNGGKTIAAGLVNEVVT